MGGPRYVDSGAVLIPQYLVAAPLYTATLVATRPYTASSSVGSGPSPTTPYAARPSVGSDASATTPYTTSLSVGSDASLNVKEVYGRPAVTRVLTPDPLVVKQPQLVGGCPSTPTGRVPDEPDVVHESSRAQAFRELRDKWRSSGLENHTQRECPQQSAEKPASAPRRRRSRGEEDLWHGMPQSARSSSTGRQMWSPRATVPEEWVQQSFSRSVEKERAWFEKRLEMAAAQEVAVLSLRDQARELRLRHQQWLLDEESNIRRLHVARQKSARRRSAESKAERERHNAEFERTLLEKAARVEERHRKAIELAAQRREEEFKDIVQRNLSRQTQYNTRKAVSDSLATSRRENKILSLTSQNDRLEQLQESKARSVQLVKEMQEKSKSAMVQTKEQIRKIWHIAQDPHEAAARAREARSVQLRQELQDESRLAVALAKEQIRKIWHNSQDALEMTPRVREATPVKYRAQAELCDSIGLCGSDIIPHMA